MLQCPPPYLGDSTGPEETTLITPGEIKTLNNAIDNQVRTIGLRIAVTLADKRDTMTDDQWNAFVDFANGWKVFYSEWQNFYRDHDSWTDNLWSANYASSKSYAKRVIEWRQLAKQRGVEFLDPEFAAPQEKKGSDVWNTVKWIGGGALVVVGIGALADLVRAYKDGGNRE